MQGVIGWTFAWIFAAIGLVTLVIGGMIAALLAFIFMVKLAAIQVEDVRQDKQRTERIERTADERYRY